MMENFKANIIMTLGNFKAIIIMSNTHLGKGRPTAKSVFHFSVPAT
jgi:hypothetical protein